MVLYVDTSSDNDFDNVVRFFHKHNIAITHRNKQGGVVGGEISEELLQQMDNEIQFEEMIHWGAEPLFGL